MKNILIVEDHPIMRAGTRQLVRSYIPDAEVTDADTLKKALVWANEKSYDLVIMDIGIPGGNSVKMVETFKSRWPMIKILILSSYEETLYALPFIKAGADGYISKDAPENDFRLALETVLFRNRIYLSENLRDESFQLFIKNGRSQENSSTLSVRERQIVQLFLSGKGVSEIAAMLDVHISTVSTHRARIFRKMGVDNLMDLSRKYDILK